MTEGYKTQGFLGFEDPLGMSQEDSVEARSLAYTEMRKAWELIDDLLGGTRVMRERGIRWLPQEPKESRQSYENRLNRSVLYGAFADTVDKLVAKPFSRSLSVDEQLLPDRLTPLVSNCDRKGTTLSQFFRGVLEDAIQHGLTYVLVDYPPVPRTLTAEQESKIYPYFTHIKATDLISYTLRRNLEGDVEVASIRIRELKSEKKEGAQYVEESVVYIREIIAPPLVRTDEQENASRWILHRKDPETGKFSPAGTGLIDFPNSIPLVTYYTKQTGILQAKPPLEDLAWLNLAHWQSSSDQRNILRFARVGLLVASGFKEEELAAIDSIGPNQLISSTNPEARLRVTEHSGASINSGRQDLIDLEDRMEVLGLQPLLNQTSRETATGHAINAQGSHCSIQSWIRDLEQMVVVCFKLAAIWVESELSEDFTADVYNEFVNPTDSGDINTLDKARERGEISRETYLRELKRRATLSERVNIEEELKVTDNGTESDSE